MHGQHTHIGARLSEQTARPLEIQRAGIEGLTISIGTGGVDALADGGQSDGYTLQLKSVRAVPLPPCQ